MSGMDMITQLTNSGAGMLFDGVIDKAVLYVPNPRKPLASNQEIGKQINTFQKKLMKDAEKKLKAGSILPKISNPITSAVGDAAGENGQFIKFEVQYNPASIRFDTIGGSQQKRGNSKGFDELNIYDMDTRTKLGFELVFDDCDNANAFMLENLTPNIGNVAKKATNLITHKGNNFSIQRKMDAMLSLLSSTGSQQVLFFWARMSFRGAITLVQNNYTMFNPQGNPIRGTMRIEITQNAKKNSIFKYEEEYWNKAFESRFTKGEVGKSMSNTLLNNNIVNLGI